MTDVPNPPAFPHPEPRDPSLTTIAAGMTLRDWFAGQALAANADNNLDVWSHAEVAADCYAYADAMLLARTKSEAGE